MTLGELGEDALLRELQSRFPPSASVPVGIGDDAAVVAFPSGENALLTTDSLVEGTHFTLGTVPARFVGRKSVAVSASDVAAMGGEARAALLSLVVPFDLEVSTFWQIIDGAAERCGELAMVLVGGNVARSRGPVVVDVTAMGSTVSGRTLVRSAARPGETLFVSGSIGGASCGLHLLESGVRLSVEGRLVVPEDLRSGPVEAAEACVRAQIDPTPRLGLGRALNEASLASACIDISDGLSVDLHRLCRASGVSARVDEPRLPISAETLAWERERKRDAAAAALGGGEDYELLFTSRDDAAVRAVGESLQIPLTPIGVIVEDPGETRVSIVSSDGSERPLAARGWDHFRRD